MSAAQRRAQRIWARVLPGGHAAQAVEGVPPSESVELAHALWQAAVGKPQQRSRSVGLERDLDGALAGRYGKRFALPAPGEHQPAVGDDLDHLAADALVAADVDAVIAAGPGVEDRRGAHPAHHLRRVGQELEDARWSRVDPDLTMDDLSGGRGLLHGASPRLRPRA